MRSEQEVNQLVAIMTVLRDNPDMAVAMLSILEWVKGE